MTRRLCIPLFAIASLLTAAHPDVRTSAEPQAGDTECSTGPRVLGVMPGMLLDLDVATGAGIPVSGPGLFRYAGVLSLTFDLNTQTLYGVLPTSSELVRIDPNTGHAEAIGFLGFGSVTAIAFDPKTDTLYGIDRDSHSLLTIDTSSGIAIPFDNTPNHADQGLAVDPESGTLFLLDWPGDIFAYDLSTGISTFVGGTDLVLDDALTFNQIEQVLYAHGRSDEYVVRIDPATAEATP